ncbi:hypothetical protein B5S31_g2250 [[Candida] boidinii]|nr:hypothetical protein B5S31_g2250 [[Candida] boidinii]GME69606.1 unnamed protein product [[Candida] boidinii]
MSSRTRSETDSEPVNTGSLKERFKSSDIVSSFREAAASKVVTNNDKIGNTKVIHKLNQPSQLLPLSENITNETVNRFTSTFNEVLEGKKENFADSGDIKAVGTSDVKLETHNNNKYINNVFNNNSHLDNLLPPFVDDQFGHYQSNNTFVSSSQDTAENSNNQMANNGAQELSKRNTQVVSASSAGIRAIMYQFTALYLRTPAKIFRPSRFDYLTSARALLHGELASTPWKFHSHSSIALLVNAVRKQGWRFIPDQVLPPLIANSASGLVLYSVYLTSLQSFNGFTMKSLQDPNPFDIYRAGFLAGAAQSLIAAPIDAIYSRSSYAELVDGKHKNLWAFGLDKLKQIGPVGVFAGYTCSFIKESFGFATYFTVFEVVKNRGYQLTRSVINWFDYVKFKMFHYSQDFKPIEHPKSEKVLQTSFVLFAGASAAASLLAIQYPITKVQNIHLSRLEALDIYNRAVNNEPRRFFKLYYNSYIQTFDQILAMKLKSKLDWWQFFYKGFVRNALVNIPATSIALLVFEITRQELSNDIESLLGPT